MGQYLPDPIVRHIHAILAADEPPGARPLYLLRMCGVCKSWREFCSEIKPELLLDGLSGVGPGASKGTLLAFRKQTLQYKRAAFEGAAAVLQGYSRVELLGECVSDEVLFRMAARNGGRLTHVKLKNTSSVSDRGLAAIIRAAPNLQELDLEQMGQSFQGTCLPLLLASCPRLTLLRIEGAPGINWHSLRPYWWPISRHTAPQQQQQEEEEGEEVVAELPEQQAVHVASAAQPGEQQQQQQQQVVTSLSMGQSTPASTSSALTQEGAEGEDDGEDTQQLGRQQPGSSHLVCPSGVTGATMGEEELVGNASQDDLLAHDPAHSRSISAANLAAGLGNSAALSSLEAAAAAVAAAAAGHASSSSSGAAPGDTPGEIAPGQQEQQRQQVVLPRLHQSVSQHHRISQPQHQQQQQQAGASQEGSDPQAEPDMPDSLSEDLQSCCTLSSTRDAGEGPEEGREASGSSSSGRQQQDPRPEAAPRAAAGGAGGGSGGFGDQQQQPALASQRHQPPLQQQQQQRRRQQQQLGPEQLRAPVTPLALQPHPPHTALKHLHVRFANLGAPAPSQQQQQQQQGGSVCALRDLLARVPGVEALVVDGPSANLELAATLCGSLGRVGYLVTSGEALDAALWPLSMMPALRELLLEVAGFLVGAEHLKVLGMLPLTELGLDSHAARQAPDMPPRAYSQVDNEGVKALVDAICMRMRMRGEVTPFKLSLCGATALKQEAVSALLRLPILTGVDTSGCSKLSPMDRMRLVAKVKAGQGLLEGKGAASGGGAGGGGGPGGAGGGLQFQGVFY